MTRFKQFEHVSENYGFIFGAGYSMWNILSVIVPTATDRESHTNYQKNNNKIKDTI